MHWIIMQIMQFMQFMLYALCFMPYAADTETIKYLGDVTWRTEIIPWSIITSGR